jgi:hypothetical protein
MGKRKRDENGETSKRKKIENKGTSIRSDRVEEEDDDDKSIREIVRIIRENINKR